MLRHMRLIPLVCGFKKWGNKQTIMFEFRASKKQGSSIVLRACSGVIMVKRF